jgi:hypothetical protein
VRPPLTEVSKICSCFGHEHVGAFASSENFLACCVAFGTISAVSFVKPRTREPAQSKVCTHRCGFNCLLETYSVIYPQESLLRS